MYIFIFDTCSCTLWPGSVGGDEACSNCVHSDPVCIHHHLFLLKSNPVFVLAVAFSCETLMNLSCFFSVQCMNTGGKSRSEGRRECKF